MVSIALIVALVLSWWAPLDRAADERLSESLENALVSFAIARTLNGVISVAQGTELAFQPAGVGVVISAGEILDPLNDLVERFSTLVLIAAASIGIQMQLNEMFAHPWVNVGLAIVLVLALAALWTPLPAGTRRFVLALAAVSVFARFLVVAASLGAALVSHAFLSERESAAIASLSSTSADLERGETAPPDASLLDRFGRFLEDPAETLDLDARIERLKGQAESAISQLINLIVVYALETVLLPIAVLYLVYALARAALRSLFEELA